MTHTLLFDGSFEGLMCALYWSFHYDTTNVHCQYDYQHNLCDRTTPITRDDAIAQKTAKRIKARFGEEAFYKIFYAFLSERPEVATEIVRFVHYAKEQPTAIQHLDHPVVWPIHKWSQAVSREAHRFIGLMRFEQLSSGIHYAKFEPGYAVLPIVSPHFVRRLNDQSWVIHDIKRKKAVFYNTQSCLYDYLAPMPVELSALEQTIQAQWCQYYDSISIKARNSDRRRMQFMPKKYWQNLTEIKHKLHLKSVYWL